MKNGTCQISNEDRFPSHLSASVSPAKQPLQELQRFNQHLIIIACVRPTFQSKYALWLRGRLTDGFLISGFHLILKAYFNFRYCFMFAKPRGIDYGSLAWDSPSEKPWMGKRIDMSDFPAAAFFQSPQHDGSQPLLWRILKEWSVLKTFFSAMRVSSSQRVFSGGLCCMVAAGGDQGCPVGRGSGAEERRLGEGLLACMPDRLPGQLLSFSLQRRRGKKQVVLFF